MTEPSLQRRFCVHEGGLRARVIEGLSFEDAALHFVADHHPADEDDEVSLYVEDIETGERQCLRIDLQSGQAEPCDSYKIGSSSPGLSGLSRYEALQI